MRLAVEVRQTHDAQGQPDAQVFDVDLPDRTNWQVATEDVTALFTTWEVTRTDRPGEFLYRDPERGSGTLRVQGADGFALRTLEEFVQLRELERAIGAQDPSLLTGRAPMGRWRWRNPWILTSVGAVGALFGVGVFGVALSRYATQDLAPATTVVSVIAGLGLGGVSVVLLVQHARRIPWWRRARAAVKAAGLPMPSDLHRF